MCLVKYNIINVDCCLNGVKTKTIIKKKKKTVKNRLSKLIKRYVYVLIKTISKKLF